MEQRVIPLPLVSSMLLSCHLLNLVWDLRAITCGPNHAAAVYKRLKVCHLRMICLDLQKRVRQRRLVLGSAFDFVL